MNEDKNIPLCVDLDDTFMESDFLYENFIRLLKKHPLYILALPFWLLKGIPHFKIKLYNKIKPDPQYLPYREEIITLIKKERLAGRKIILVTATNIEAAKSIANYWGIFDDVYGTEKVNLKGENKKERLVSIFGNKGYDYVGDSKSDVPVFNHARKVYLINPSSKIINDIKNNTNIVEIFRKKSPLLRTIIKEIRVYQWVKNILIFLPVIMAHKFDASTPWLYALIGFISFSLTASSVYVLNDLMDIESDRAHPRKKKRPLASGELPISIALFLIPMLIFAGIGLSTLLPGFEFFAILAVYFFLTSLYSFVLKKLYIADIIVLASLYTIRLIAGAAAADVPLSHWLMAFSMFIFLSLALLKRYTELLTMREAKKTNSRGRGYNVGDIDLIRSMGTSAGLLSVLVFALYVYSSDTMPLYNNPQILYGVSPFLLYWVLRIWFLSHRGKMTDDPIVFTVKDPVSYFIGFIVALLAIVSAL